MTDQPARNKLKLTFRHRPNQIDLIPNDQSAQLPSDNKATDRPGSLKVNLVRKPTNSPILSVQNYIHQSLQHQLRPLNIKSIWEKYQKIPLHSTIIKNHRIDYEAFRKIAEQILTTLEPYSVQVAPISTMADQQIKLSERDLVDKVL